ncbi:fibronectin type III-like domain-contianing protein [Streptomyces wedmorensis]
MRHARCAQGTDAPGRSRTPREGATAYPTDRRPTTPPPPRRTAPRPAGRPHIPAGRPRDPPRPPCRRSRLSQRALLPALTGGAALAGYRSLELAAGERRRVTVAVTARTLSSWGTARHDWTLGTGRRTLRVGASSGDPGLTADVEVGPA